MRIGLPQFLSLTCVSLAALGFVAVGSAQAPEPQLQAHGVLNQVMRGILFPNSNVVFATQLTDPAAVKLDADGPSSTNPLTGLYGQWQAVENSSIALAEAANLLTIPGRECSNGEPVPVGNEDWATFVQGLRDAGMTSYKAAQAKDLDGMLDAAGIMSEACAACHQVYRDVETRCRK